jgi:hypothetical protein
MPPVRGTFLREEHAGLQRQQVFCATQLEWEIKEGPIASPIVQST